MSERQRLEIALLILQLKCSALYEAAKAEHDAAALGYARKALAVCETAIDQIRSSK